jgi:cytoskeletal protein RodZ
MRPTDKIEKLLSETAVPGLKDGLHRVALKRELMAQMQSKERLLVEEPLQNDGDLALATRTNPWRRIMQPQWIAVAAVVAVVAVSVVVRLTSNRAVVAPPELAHVASSDSSGAAGAVVVQPPSTRNLSATKEPATRSLSLQRRTLEQSVAGAEVIVVATALDSAPAPPKRPGDGPEVLIRFRVARVLKGKLAEEVITTRTPTSADDFIGKEWVIMLSPEYMAGKHQFADCNWIKAEPEVKAILAKVKK